MSEGPREIQACLGDPAQRPVCCFLGHKKKNREHWQVCPNGWLELFCPLTSSSKRVVALTIDRRLIVIPVIIVCATRCCLPIAKRQVRTVLGCPALSPQNQCWKSFFLLWTPSTCSTCAERVQSCRILYGSAKCAPSLDLRCSSMNSERTSGGHIMPTSAPLLFVRWRRHEVSQDIKGQR